MTSIKLPAGSESWEDVTIVNGPGANSYPIASFSYLLLYQDLSTNIDNVEKARALVDFIQWAITDGQQFADELSYVPLPDSVVQHNMQTLESLTFQGQPMLAAVKEQQHISSFLFIIYNCHAHYIRDITTHSIKPSRFWSTVSS